MGSAVRERGKEHIPRYPRGWITIRILQLIFALITLGLNGYLVAYRTYASFIIAIFAAVCTMIISIWLISAHSCSPRAFNYWACLILDIYLYIVWLSALTTSTIDAAWILTHGFGYGRGSGYSSSDIDLDFDYSDLFDKLKLSKRYYYSSDSGPAAAIVGTSAGVGAIEFLLFFICLVTDAIVIYRHRKVGLHSRPVKHYGASMPVQSVPVGVPSAYQAVPQQGIPYQHQQVTAYNPHGPYNQPQHTYPYPVAKSVSPGPPSSAPTPQPYSQPYSPQPQYPVQQPPTGGH